MLGFTVLLQAELEEEEIEKSTGSSSLFWLLTVATKRPVSPWPLLLLPVLLLLLAPAFLVLAGGARLRRFLRGDKGNVGSIGGGDGVKDGD